MTDWISDLLFWIVFVTILFFLRGKRIFWTVGALGLLLLFNQFFTPGFFIFSCSMAICTVLESMC